MRKMMTAVGLGVVLVLVGCGASTEDETVGDDTERAEGEDDGESGDEGAVASSESAYGVGGTATACPSTWRCSTGNTGHGFKVYTFWCRGRAPYVVRTSQGCSVR
jgi:major membrane immunogen (membrane-anchored lipoprotein)